MTILFARIESFRTVFHVPLIFGLLALTVIAQAPSEAFVKKEDIQANQTRGLDMLRQVQEILRAEYYMDLSKNAEVQANFKAAEERIKGLERNSDVYRTIAQVLIGLNDSHTVFYPPNFRYRVEYGFSMMTIGAGTFIVEVKEGTDAKAKGLRAGDEIVSFMGFKPDRQNLDPIRYIIYSLEPQEDVTLTIKAADGSPKEVVVKSKFISPEERRKERKALLDDLKKEPFTCAKVSDDITACKLKTFFVDKRAIDKMMEQAAATHKLVLDLRGNGGGLVDTSDHLIGWFFDRDVKIGTERRKSKTRELSVKGKSKGHFAGEVAILIDSESASASEVVARVLQLEKRARIIGDVSKGAVMASVRFGMRTETRARTLNDVNVPYYLSFLNLSVADLTMNDGGRLEGKGVIPDSPVGPTPIALRDGNDPVLAVAVESLGGKITSEEAGKLFFLLPKPEVLSDKTDEGDK